MSGEKESGVRPSDTAWNRSWSTIDARSAVATGNRCAAGFDDVAAAVEGVATVGVVPASTWCRWTDAVQSRNATIVIVASPAQSRRAARATVLARMPFTVVCTSSPIDRQKTTLTLTHLFEHLRKPRVAAHSARLDSILRGRLLIRVFPFAEVALKLWCG